MKENQVSFYEVLSIRYGEDGTFVYTAHPAGQGSTSFAATQTTRNNVVFTNPDHDYPQEIEYLRQGDQLTATISLIGGDRPAVFRKHLCETPAH
ncbi:MAG: DUF6265 family protein [bacterium]